MIKPKEFIVVDPFKHSSLAIIDGKSLSTCGVASRGPHARDKSMHLRSNFSVTTRRGLAWYHHGFATFLLAIVLL